MRMPSDAGPATPDARQTQGDLSTLDDVTDQEATALRQQMSGIEGPHALPFIWGSVRVLSVYGKWSFWRSPKRKI
jgi:hypothetical protein